MKKEIVKELENGITIIQQYYYDDTILNCEIIFENDKKVCVKKYHDNGRLRSETPYANNRANGVRKCYNENGDLYLEIPFFNNMKHGVIKTWYDNGVLASEEPYKNNKRNGITKYYDENGNLIKEIKYVSDVEIERKVKQ